MGEKFKKVPLILTVDKSNKFLITLIDKLILKGYKIINLGLLSNNKTLKYFKKYSHIIYPSLSESLGLVLIEAIKYRNIILSSNLKIFEEVIKPDFYLILIQKLIFLMPSKTVSILKTLDLD